MKDNLKLCSLALSRRNRPFWVTAILIFITTTLQCAAISLISFHQMRLEQSRSNVYGYFYSLVYQTPADYENQPVDDSYGTIQVVRYFDDSGQSVRIGTYNPPARDLMYQGRENIDLPADRNSCLITRSFAAQSANAEAEALSFGGMSLAPVRTIPDIGYLWPRGESEILSDMLTPDIWVNSDTFNALASSGPAQHYRILLLNREQAQALKDGYLSLPGNSYINMNIVRDENRYIYKIDRAFSLSQLLLFPGLLLLLLMGYSHYSRQRYAIYSDLGLALPALTAVVRSEFAAVSVMPFACGLAAGGIVTFLCTNGMYPGLQIFTFSGYFEILKYYILVYFAGLLIGMLLARRTVHQKDRIRRKSGHRSRLPVKGTAYILFSAPLLLLLTYILLVVVSSFTSVNALNEAVYTERHGQIRQNYDFEITYEDFSLDSKHYRNGTDLIQKESSAFGAIPFFFSNHSGQLDHIINYIEELDGVQRVDTFYTNMNTLMAIPETTAASEFFERVFRSPRYFPDGPFTDLYVPEIQSAFGECVLYCYPDTYLTSIAGQMDLAPEALSSVLSGDSVILEAPAICIKEEAENYVAWKRDTEGDIVLNDPALDTYTSVRLCIPQADRNLEGFIPQEALTLLGARLAMPEIPVAGVTNRNLGWFDINDLERGEYRVFASGTFFKKHSIWHEANRVRIFLDEGADADYVSRQLQLLTNSISNVRIVDRHYNLEMWHEYRTLEKVIYVLYAVLSLGLLISFAFSISYCYWLENQRNVTLYRDLGITARRLFYSLAAPFLLFLLLFLFLQLLFEHFALSILLVGWQHMSLPLRIAVPSAIFGVYAALFAGALGSRIRELFRRQDYYE